MDPALKQRLVGAVVLVALAVIFLPMLLDGSGAREQLDEEIAIPEKPEPPESHLDPVEPPTETPETGESREPDAEPAATASGDDEGAAEPETATGDTAASAQEPAADADNGSAVADETEPAGSADTASVDAGWIVQVGSFRRETNALVLRDRLRQEGFDADAERAQAGGDTVWRVLVGPVAERAEGESLKRRLEELRGEQALLMSYP